MDGMSDSRSESSSGVSVCDTDSFDSAKEQALIKNIRKLAHENQTIKLGLANHNKLIGVCIFSKTIVSCMISIILPR